MQLRSETGMTPIFITHDIGLAYYVSDSVYIMEHGKFVESGPAEDVILHPKAAYTQRLISDVPKIYEEWDLSLDDALANETRLGLQVIASGETQAGARRFAEGAGRHGAV